MIRALAALFLAASFSAGAASYALVLQDETPLRPAPGASLRPSAVLWQGEMVEVRGERLDYLQVWDYARERGGFVRASQMRRLAMTADEAPELLAVLRFLRDVPGSEALGIAIAAAYVEAAPAEALTGSDGVEALDAMASLAERLARSASGATQLKAAAVSARLDVAARYGVRFVSVERNGRVRVCYDGAAWRKLLAVPASAEQRARAALALSEPACAKPDPAMAEMLERIDRAALAGYMGNRLLMRRASVWARLSYQQARGGKEAGPEVRRAAEALAAVQVSELAEADHAAHAETELRVGAMRVALTNVSSNKDLYIVTSADESGRTCIVLRNAKNEDLKRRCTYGLVWTGSAVANREGTALVVAVQPTDAWRELWLFCKTKDGWRVRALPPATEVGVGYTDFAGWTSGGVRVRRAAMVSGKATRTTRRVGF